MAAVIGELRPRIRLPYGVDMLWDPMAALALAQAVRASFVREVFTGVYDSDMGLWQPVYLEQGRVLAEVGDRVIVPDLLEKRARRKRRHEHSSLSRVPAAHKALFRPGALPARLHGLLIKRVYLRGVGNTAVLVNVGSHLLNSAQRTTREKDGGTLCRKFFGHRRPNGTTCAKNDGVLVG